MAQEALKRCLAIVQLRSDSSIQRIAADVPAIMEFITRFSRGEHEQAFRSCDGLLFGYFLKTATPQFLLPEFQKCKGTRNGDTVLIFEAGELIAGDRDTGLLAYKISAPENELDRPKTRTHYTYPDDITIEPPAR